MSRSSGDPEKDQCTGEIVEGDHGHGIGTGGQGGEAKVFIPRVDGLEELSKFRWISLPL